MEFNCHISGLSGSGNQKCVGTFRTRCEQIGFKKLDELERNDGGHGSD